MPDINHAITASVAEAYGHAKKVASAGTWLRLPAATLKWYRLHGADAPIDPVFEEQARQFLIDEAETGALDLRDQLGFVQLHRCGSDFYFLLVSTWRNNNELWETTYYHDPQSNGFQFFRRPATHLPTFCVWELGIVWHEKLAWSRFLQSARDDAAISVYLEDQFAGSVI